LEAAKEVDAKRKTTADSFVDIDDFDQDSASTKKAKPSKEDSVFVSTQMPNGRWTCNHSCRDGKPLKNGEVCKHKCCVEGLEKPRKLQPKVRGTIHVFGNAC
jgi:ATP-dependent DNA helicase HFM1/MER3